MIERRRLVALLTACAALCPVTVHATPPLTDLRQLIREQLVYPRQARFALPPRLPTEAATAAQNAEWLRVAQAIALVGVLKSRHVDGKLVLEADARSTDAVVPSVNLRYETTSLNVIVGYWDVEIADVERKADVIVVHGRRKLTRRSRVHDAVISGLDREHVAAFSDHDVTWEISGLGASAAVREVSR